MNLDKAITNPSRVLKWNNKSLAICSRKELIDCIVAQSRLMAQMNQNIKELKAAQQAKVEMVQDDPKKNKSIKKS